MKTKILICVSIIIIIFGIFVLIPKDYFVYPEEQSTEDNIFNIIDIENFIIETNQQEKLYSRNWQTDGEFLGEYVTEYMKENEISEIGIRANMTKNSVEFVSFDEKINNQKFYYTNEGNLVAYISISNKGKGSIAYYFSNNKQIKLKNEYDNTQQYPIEEADSILSRAENVYTQYIVEKECKVDIAKLEETIVTDDGITVGNIKCEYPVLTRNENNKVINKINGNIKQDAVKRYNEDVKILKTIGHGIQKYEEVAIENENGEVIIEKREIQNLVYNYYIKETYLQKYLDYKTISYLIEIEKNVGEGIEKTIISKNYDLLTGKELTIYDIYCGKSKEDLNRKLINRFEVKYDKYILNNTVVTKNIGKVKFYLTNDNVVFYFDKLVITNENISMPEIQMTYKELE